MESAPLIRLRLLAYLWCCSQSQSSPVTSRHCAQRRSIPSSPCARNNSCARGSLLAAQSVVATALCRRANEFTRGTPRQSEAATSCSRRAISCSHGALSPCKRIYISQRLDRARRLHLALAARSTEHVRPRARPPLDLMARRQSAVATT